MSRTLNAARRAHAPVRSALGISRIADVQVSQVVHATPSDTATLHAHLSRWQVPSFQSFPLLLRALTHTSVSNWAERILHLPKRSLSPSTLELLGDRVVGVAVAHAVLHWARHGPRQSDPASAPVSQQLDWAGGPRAVIVSLVGNRGMADAARHMQVPQLMRWEKARPPMPHRARLTADGVDRATGIPSNVETNALAAAYEAVAAAVYLDGGYHPSRNFVDATLLAVPPAQLQTLNRDVRDHETALLRELPALLPVPLATPHQHPPTPHNRFAPAPHDQAVLQILDLQRAPPPHANPQQAHTVFYTAVVLRPVSQFAHPIRDTDLLALSSHFSVSTARIAALSAARSAIRAEHPRAASLPLSPRDNPGAPALHERLVLREDIASTTTSSSSSPSAPAHADSNQPPTSPTHQPEHSPDKQPLLPREGLIAAFDTHGAWTREGDFAHTAHVLARAGLRGLADVRDGADAEARLAVLRDARDADEAALHAELDARAAAGRSGRRGSRVGADGKASSASSSREIGALPRRAALGGGVTDEPCRETVTACLAAGTALLNGSGLGAAHDGARVGADDADGETDGQTRADAIVAAVRDGLLEAGGGDGDGDGDSGGGDGGGGGGRLWMRRRRELGGLNALGHQVLRLWAAQASIERVEQDRQQVMPMLERRAGLMDALTPAMLGRSGALSGLRDLRAKPGYVALGAVVDRVGVDTALAWLAGAEARWMMDGGARGHDAERRS